MSVTEIGGVKIFTRPCDTSVVNEVFLEDSYRIGKIPFHSTIIDIGSHIGTFTLRCAVERMCKVYAYEPSGDEFVLLQQNVALNNMGDRVSCFNLAVCGQAGIRQLHIDTLHFSSCFDLESERTLRVENVYCVTLADIFRENNIDMCNVIKLDCEKSEREIFTAEFEQCFMRTGRVIMEFHLGDGLIYADYLRKLGFQVELTGCGPNAKWSPGFSRGMLYADKDV